VNIKITDKLADEEFMRAGSPHPYYGTLYEAMDLNLLDEYMSMEEVVHVLSQLQPKIDRGVT
jgi:hypothetical protein